MRISKTTLLRALAFCGLFFIPFTTCTAQESRLVSIEAGPPSVSTQNSERQGYTLAPNALQMARIIGVEADIEKLSSLAGAARAAGGTPGLSLEELALRQLIADKVLAASLDVDVAASEIDYEREQMVELRSLLRYKRDRAIGSTNLAVLVAGTGLGIVSGLLQFSETTSEAGNAVGFAAGGVSTLFSLRSFRQVHGGKRPAWVLPNMLANFLAQPEEEHSHYPDNIRVYLNSVPPGVVSQATRKEQVVTGWIAAGRIIGAPDSPQAKRRIALLTSTNAADKNLTIEVLNERAAMLADVGYQVLLMKHDLAALLRGLRP